MLFLHLPPDIVGTVLVVLPVGGHGWQKCLARNLNAHPSPPEPLSMKVEKVVVQQGIQVGVLGKAIEPGHEFLEKFIMALPRADDPTDLEEVACYNIFVSPVEPEMTHVMAPHPYSTRSDVYPHWRGYAEGVLPVLVYSRLKAAGEFDRRRITYEPQ